jgi:hypothetical protein
MASNKANRRKYEEVLAVVCQELAQWDPYSLLAEGAPPDEFQAEAAALVPLLLRARSSAEASLAVSQVFSKSFGESDFDQSQCDEVGLRLHAALMAHGHIE